MKSTLRWIGIAAVVGALAWTLTAGQRGGGPRVGGDAPDFSVDLLEGGTFSLADHRGQVVVLDFWATWCGPCKMTLPAVQEVAARHKGDAGIYIATVNTDRGSKRADALKRWLGQRKLDFPVLLDDDRQTVSTTYNVRAIPTMVVVGRDGRVASVTVGLPASNQADIVQHIEAAIAEAADGG
ncbi:MAG: TlpA family protein disulfide reductase [Myxococcales bacterium]|nr:TlpA family protein disulfide reductase [Myxococcales bacterium]MCB9546252.1 TlpA family protein disulfide reductase [Myxococcales bacterium]